MVGRTARNVAGPRRPQCDGVLRPAHPLTRWSSAVDVPAIAAGASPKTSRAPRPRDGRNGSGGGGLGGEGRGQEDEDEQDGQRDHREAAEQGKGEGA